MLIAGIDPSLTRTGWALIDTTTGHITTGTIPTRGHAADPLTTRWRRIITITTTLTRHLGHPAHAAIETPAYHSRTGHMHDRSGLWWHITHHLLTTGTHVTEITPATRARYATGRGNATKDDMVRATLTRHPHVPITTHDEADALTLAAITARLTGHPIDDPIPPASHDALTPLTPPPPRENR